MHFFAKNQLLTSDMMLLKTSAQDNNKAKINNKIAISQENFEKRLQYITNNELQEPQITFNRTKKEKELRKQYQKEQMSFMSTEEKTSYENILKINTQLDSISVQMKKINQDIRTLEAQNAQANEQEKTEIRNKVDLIYEQLKQLQKKNKQFQNDQTLAIAQHITLFQNLQTQEKFSQIDITPYHNALKEIYDIQN